MLFYAWEVGCHSQYIRACRDVGHFRVHRLLLA